MRRAGADILITYAAVEVAREMHVLAEYLVDARTLSKMQGVPLRASEIDLGIELLDAAISSVMGRV